LGQPAWGEAGATDAEACTPPPAASFSLAEARRAPPLLACKEVGCRAIAAACTQNESATSLPLARTQRARLPRTGRARVVGLLWLEADGMGEAVGDMMVPNDQILQGATASFGLASSHGLVGYNCVPIEGRRNKGWGRVSVNAAPCSEFKERPRHGGVGVQGKEHGHGR
jgi:hypothetical protein